MRFYVMAVQHNKEKNAENRTVPVGFDDEFEARTNFYDTLAKDRKNQTLDWGVVYLLDNMGNNPLERERWDRPQPEPTPENNEIVDEVPTE